MHLFCLGWAEYICVFTEFAVISKCNYCSSSWGKNEWLAGIVGPPILWLSRCQDTAVQGLSWSSQDEQLPSCPATELCEQGRRKDDWNRQSQQWVYERYHEGHVGQLINKAIMLFFCILWCLSAFYRLSFCGSSQIKWIFIFIPNAFLLTKLPLLKKKSLRFLKPRSSLPLPYQFSLICHFWQALWGLMHKISNKNKI